MFSIQNGLKQYSKQMRRDWNWLGHTSFWSMQTILSHCVEWGGVGEKLL